MRWDDSTTSDILENSPTFSQSSAILCIFSKTLIIPYKYYKRVYVWKKTSETGVVDSIISCNHLGSNILHCRTHAGQSFLPITWAHWWHRWEQIGNLVIF